MKIDEPNLEWVNPNRMWQINAIAQLAGLPKDAPGHEIIQTLKAKATSAGADKLREQLREYIRVPEGRDPIEFTASALGTVANRAAADKEAAKVIIANAIADGRFGVNDANAHRAFLEQLVANRSQVEPLVNGFLANRADTSQPYEARRFVGRVRAEEAAGASKAQAVANAVKAEPGAHAAWVNSGCSQL